MNKLLNKLQIALALNVPSLVLILIGLATFGLACVCHAQDVRSEVMGAATSIIGAGLIAFQHPVNTNDPVDDSKKKQ